MGYGHRKGIENKDIEYVDMHGHYGHWKFKDNRKETFEKMKRNGCQFIVECGCDLKSINNTIKLAQENDFIYASIGFFPHNVQELYKKNVREQFLQLLDEYKVVMIGECGFDFSRKGVSAKEQEKEFRWQIELAIDKKMPICIHSRDAEEDTIRVLNEYKKEKDFIPYIHSYSYGYDTAMKLQEMGAYFGCGGMLTYKRNEQLRYALRDIDEQYILFETDAPYLPPESLRGQINTALNIPQIANVLAGVREENPINLMQQATKNSYRLLSLEQ